LSHTASNKILGKIPEGEEILRREPLVPESGVAVGPSLFLRLRSEERAPVKAALPPPSPAAPDYTYEPDYGGDQKEDHHDIYESADYGISPYQD
jgi:hypothetical protein